MILNLLSNINVLQKLLSNRFVGLVLFHFFVDQVVETHSMDYAPHFVGLPAARRRSSVFVERPMTNANHIQV